MPPASSRALFSIVAAASALDKLCGSAGRCLEVWEKNRGEGGEFNLGGTPLENDSGSSVCRGLNFGQLRFGDRSEAETILVPLSSDRGCFEACVSFGVMS
jgi:hypothetical protein